MDIEVVVAEYVAARDLIREIDDKLKTCSLAKKREELVQFKSQREGMMQEFLDAHRVESMRTKAGTCYKTTRSTASLEDAEGFMNFVIETNKFELLDRRANATAVKDFVKENGQLPPGCKLTTVDEVGVRRPTKKSTSPVTAAVTAK